MILAVGYCVNSKRGIAFSKENKTITINNADAGFLSSYTGVCCLRENVFYAYFPNVLLDLAAAFAAMVLVDSNKEVVGATGHISTRPVAR